MAAQFATPGPWEVKKDDDQFRIRQKGTVRRIAGGTIERPVGEGFNYKLDAQLAACAPELRDLLTEARATLEMWKDVAPAISLCADIDKLLSRANGESK